MKVETYIKKTDHIYTQYYLIPRLKINILTYLFFVLFFGFSSKELIDKAGILIFIFSVFISLTFIFFLFYTAIILIQTFFLTEAKGNIGKQLIEVDDTYFSATTAVGQTKIKWMGIHKLFKNKKHIYIVITGFRAYIIPKRSFSSEAQFDAFWELIKKHHENH